MVFTETRPMKAPLRTSQFCQLIEEISGLSMAKYGMPYDGVLGSIYPENVDFMLVAIERFPELHVVSYRKDFSGVNRFIEGAAFYRLALGDADPDITFTSELLDSDYPVGNEEHLQQILHSFRTERMEDDPIMMAALNWLVNKMTTAK